MATFDSAVCQGHSSVTDAMEEVEMDNCTATDMCQWLREVCTTKLIQKPIILERSGIIVEMDESLCAGINK